MESNTILLVSATVLEVKPLLDKYSHEKEENFYHLAINKNDVDLLITGVGIHAMTYSLTKALSQKKYKFIILAGIAGSYNSNYKLGEVVNVITERFSDLGIQKPNSFQSIFDMGLLDNNAWPYTDGEMTNYTLINNKAVNKLTNTIGNTVQTIKTDHIISNSNTDIESMEGAAFFYTCMMEKQAFIQIRSISNYVGETDKNKWDIPLSVNNLCRSIEAIFVEINPS